MPSLAVRPGRSKKTMPSKRPSRNRAPCLTWSSRSASLQVPIRKTRAFDSDRHLRIADNWSRETPLSPACSAVAPARASSISSSKTQQGAIASHREMNRRTLPSDSPTNLALRVGRSARISGMWLSAAMAFATVVLPMFGGPTNSQPLGGTGQSGRRSCRVR